jgi:hypothetical protein
MITASMGADLDFEDVAVGRAGDFFQWFAATGTALLLFGQGAGFVAGGEMIVVTSAMPFAAWLLPALASLGVVGGVGIGLGRRGGFGFSSIATAFQFADFPLQTLHVFLQIRFTLDGAVMEGPPIVGLQTQLEELEPATAQDREGAKKEPSESAKASPQQGKEVWFEINQSRTDMKQRSLLRGPRNQGKRLFGIHAPKSYAPKRAQNEPKQRISGKTVNKLGKLYAR